MDGLSLRNISGSRDNFSISNYHVLLFVFVRTIYRIPQYDLVRVCSNRFGCDWHSIPKRGPTKSLTFTLIALAQANFVTTQRSVYNGTRARLPAKLKHQTLTPELRCSVAMSRCDTNERCCPLRTATVRLTPKCTTRKHTHVHTYAKIPIHRTMRRSNNNIHGKPRADVIIVRLGQLRANTNRQTDREMKHLGGPVSRWCYWCTVRGVLRLPTGQVLVHGYLSSNTIVTL